MQMGWWRELRVSFEEISLSLAGFDPQGRLCQKDVRVVHWPRNKIAYPQQRMGKLHKTGHSVHFARNNALKPGPRTEILIHKGHVDRPEGRKRPEGGLWINEIFPWEKDRQIDQGLPHDLHSRDELLQTYDAIGSTTLSDRCHPVSNS